LDGDRPDHADQSGRRRPGPRHIVRRGKTPVLDPAEARQLLDAIDTMTVIGLRDRALIGLMVYSFARRERQKLWGFRRL
jgi:integrase